MSFKIGIYLLLAFNFGNPVWNAHFTLLTYHHTSLICATRDILEVLRKAASESPLHCILPNKMTSTNYKPWCIFPFGEMAGLLQWHWSFEECWLFSSIISSEIWSDPWFSFDSMCFVVLVSSDTRSIRILWFRYFWGFEWPASLGYLWCGSIFVYCLVSAISAPRFIYCIPSIWSAAPIFSILLTEENSSSSRLNVFMK